MKKHFHVIWTSFGTYQIWDNRGHWNSMLQTYHKLEKTGVGLKFHYELPQEFLYKPYPSNQRIFSAEQLNFLQKEILELTKTDGDRVAGDLTIEHLDCCPTYINLIIQEEEGLLKKKIARIKSKTGALLALQYPELFTGRNTWGKGIWMVEVVEGIESVIPLFKINSEVHGH